MMYFKPKNGLVGDTIPYYYNSEYHLFYLIAQQDQNDFIKRVSTSWGHFVSTDILNWKELPIALEPSGKDGSPDKSACWTGSVIEKDGIFNLFYTGGYFDNVGFRQTICHAHSKDLIHWKKNPINPILTADERWYELNDWRDPFVFWDEKENVFICLQQPEKNWMEATYRMHSTSEIE